MGTLFLIFIATFAISLLAFSGMLVLALREKLLNKILLVLVALSAGALMGGAFLHLIPEGAEKMEIFQVSLFVLLGFVLFFLIEKIMHWRHCHKGKCTIHTFGYMNLFGDAIHNFIDGLIIAASFITSIPLGLATSLAVAIHEIPQEIGDFGVLIYSGFKKFRALFLNFTVALTVVFGGIAGFFLSKSISGLVSFLLPFAAGGFIYIAATDLIPEIRKEKSLRKSLLYFSIFILGLLIMYLLRG